MEHGNGYIICFSSDGDYKKSYDNYMVLRGAMYAHNNYAISPTTNNLVPLNFPAATLGTAVAAWEANRYLKPFIKK